MSRCPGVSVLIKQSWVAILVLSDECVSQFDQLSHEGGQRRYFS